jgi:hypothetical protein
MKKFWVVALCVACLTLMANASDDDDKSVTLTATMVGLNETPPTASPATGKFKAWQNPDGTFGFSLEFSGLSANAAVSHIHFGFPKVAGGVMIFLCGGGGQPACPAATSGTISGTFGAANVVGPTAQGITAGDFATAMKEVLGGAGYANLHTSTFPAGEIRGQVKVHRGDHDRDDQ